MKTVADLLRWFLILFLWGAAAYLLWGIAWFWAVIWLVPGLYVVVNLVGFATLPLYYFIRRGDFHQLLDESEQGSSSE